MSSMLDDALAVLRGDLARGTSDLPMLPPAATETLQLAQSAELDLRQVARVAESHPPLAARVLAIANSALYSRGRDVSSIHAALVRLGANSTRDVLYQAAYASGWTATGAALAYVEGVFERSVLTGRATRTLAFARNADGGLGYLCGLLHDVGEARCARLLAKRFPNQWHVEFEAAIELTHAEAGAAVAAAWRLPSEVIAAAEHHHDADHPDLYVREVGVADALIAALQAGPELDTAALCDSLGARVGRDATEIASLLAALRVDLTTSRAA